jgi:putative addiction module killer protein
VDRAISDGKAGYEDSEPTQDLARLARVRLGNLGDGHAVGRGIWELRIDYGPGYRMY